MTIPTAGCSVTLVLTHIAGVTLVLTHIAGVTLVLTILQVLLAQCVVYLARAPKSVEIYQAYSKAKTCVGQHKGPLPSVPLHLRNAPTRLMKNLGECGEHCYMVRS